MRQPNIIVILVDDLGWRDLSCYGSSFYETPRLDDLAASGMRFTDAYASCPVCSPTRASLMTGKYPATMNITNYIYGNAEGKLKGVPYLPHLPLEETTIASALRESGYATWHVGKWHLGGDAFEPQHQGFDVNIGGCHWGLPKHGYVSPYGMPHLEDGPPGEFLTDRLTDEAIGLIARRDPAKPFFLNLCHYAVHVPIEAPAHLVEKYRKKAAALGLDRIDPFEKGEEFPCIHLRGHRVKRRVIQSNPTYAAMIENLDGNVGRLMDALAANGIREDTLVIFTSDNGGLATAESSPTCNLPLLEGKGWVYEGGTRVCQICSWPGTIPAGTTCSAPTTTTDFYPTFLEAAGLPLRPKQHVDGASILPLLRGADSIARRDLFWHYPHYSNQGGTPACSIRSDDWKLIEFFEDHHLELYDLRRDPGETIDLAQTEPGRARELHARLAAWRERIEAQIPEPNPDFERLYRLPPETYDVPWM